jgi:hypothetical protein
MASVYADFTDAELDSIAADSIDAFDMETSQLARIGIGHPQYHKDCLAGVAMEMNRRHDVAVSAETMQFDF